MTCFFAVTTGLKGIEMLLLSALLVIVLSNHNSQLRHYAIFSARQSFETQIPSFIRSR